MTVPTRRARSAAWIHHFDHKATWCPLYINLPNAVIVHEVVIQPHSATLSSEYWLGGLSSRGWGWGVMEAGLMEKAFLLTLSTGLLQVVSTSLNKFK